MNKEQNDNLEFLFSRLTWPSLMVRERACTSISELLMEDEQTVNYLEGWMKSQQLESVAIFGLLILIRAKMLSDKFELPLITELNDSLDTPSALSYLLLKELEYDNVSKPDWSSICLAASPEDFMPSDFFSKYCTNYIPSIYKTHARNIEQKYGIPFYRHWSYEWQKILEKIDRKPTPEPLHFRGRPEYEHYDGVDFILSEAYRSAYLRTLAWAINKKGFREEDATYLAIKTCPIDPSLWKVQSLPKPQWWPTTVPSSGIIDTVVGDIWKKVGCVWQESVKSKGEWIVAQANGRVCQTDDSVYDLEIRGVLQRCRGSNKPDLDEVFKETSCKIPYVTTSVGLEGYINHEPVSEYAKLVEDWEILPVACQVWPYTTPRWQSRRLRRGIWVPAPFISNKIFEMKCMPERLDIFDGDDLIGKWQDWNWNLREKVTANLAHSTGEYLLLKRAILDEFVDRDKCSFGWICRITHYHREHFHEEYKTHVYLQDYGTSSIIIQ